MTLYDIKNGYGWISIILHWIATIIIVALWFIGNSIEGPDLNKDQQLLTLHISIAASAYLILWCRIFWRWYYEHPGPSPKQDKLFFTVGKWVHYSLLFTVSVMLFTGPLTVWFGGDAIVVFDLLSIPSPMDENIGLRNTFALIHGITSVIVAMLILLHILGTFKHIIFDRDGTFDKIMIAAKDIDTTR